MPSHVVNCNYTIYKRFLLFLTVHVEDEAQHGAWILPGWEKHVLVAGESNVSVFCFFFHRLIHHFVHSSLKHFNTLKVRLKQDVFLLQSEILSSP